MRRLVAFVARRVRPPVDLSRRLRDMAVVESSSKRYVSAFMLFEKFVRVKFGVDVKCLGVDRMDQFLEVFIESCYRKFKGGRYQLCVNAVQGIQAVCGYHFKHVLPTSRRCLRAWQKQVPAQSAQPMP